MRLNRVLKKVLFLFIFMLCVMILPVFSHNVKALTIVIDPGHGGNDDGASNSGLVESELTMKIATYLKEYLSEYPDLNIILTHTGQTMSLEDRADFARNNKADLMLSIHINSNQVTSLQGCEAYVTYRTDLPKYNENMTRLGNMILRNIQKLGISGIGTVQTKKVVNSENEDEYKYFDGTPGDYYGIIRRSMKGGHELGLGPNFGDGSGVPVVLIEHAYLSNSHDRAFLDSDDDLRALARADCDAVVEFYSLSKTNNIDISGYMFDSEFYYNKYEDLRNAFGYNVEALKNHYYTFRDC